MDVGWAILANASLRNVKELVGEVDFSFHAVLAAEDEKGKKD